MEKLSDLFLATERQLRGLEKGDIRVIVERFDYDGLRPFLTKFGWNGIYIPEMTVEELKILQKDVLYEMERIQTPTSEIFKKHF